MFVRTLVALSLAALVGCGTSPSHLSAPQATGANSAAVATTRSEQKRAVAGKESATVGPIKAEVLSFGLEKPKVKMFGKESELPEAMMVVRVRFSTTDDTVKRAVAGALIDPSCKDEFGNSYSITNATSVDVVGDEPLKDVTRETPVMRVILIERPIAKATRLDLDLSASFVGVGEEEKFRFSIPLK